MSTENTENTQSAPGEPEKKAAPEPRFVSENDLSMLRRAHTEKARAEAKFQWALEEIGIRYRFTQDQRVDLGSGEIVAATDPNERK